MAWMQLAPQTDDYGNIIAPGAWVNTAAGDPYSPDAYRSDAQHRQQVAADNAAMTSNGLGRFLNPADPNAGAYVAPRPDAPDPMGAGTVSNTGPENFDPRSHWQRPTQEMLDRGVMATFNDIVQQFGAQAPQVLAQMGGSGYFDQFPDWAEHAQEIGSWVASRQDEATRNTPGLVGGIAGALGLGQDDEWLTQLALTVAAGNAGALTGAEAGAAPATAGTAEGFSGVLAGTGGAGGVGTGAATAGAAGAGATAAMPPPTTGVETFQTFPEASPPPTAPPGGDPYSGMPGQPGPTGPPVVEPSTFPITGDPNAGASTFSDAALGTAGAAAGAAAGNTLGDALGNGVGTALGNGIGDLIGGGLGILGAERYINYLEGESRRNREERAPFLGAATNYLNDPNAYINGPGQAGLQGVLRGLSVRGNPVGNPASLEIATHSALNDWRNAVTGFGNMGLSGADTRAGLATNIAGAQAGQFGSLGYGLSGLVGQQQPRPSSGGGYLV